MPTASNLVGVVVVGWLGWLKWLGWRGRNYARGFQPESSNIQSLSVVSMVVSMVVVVAIALHHTVTSASQTKQCSRRASSAFVLVFVVIP